MNVLPYIAQNGVHHKVFGNKGTHNAMWDFAISPQGKIYLSLCSELIESSYARFYEYIPEQDAFDLLFRVEDVILPADRTIRHSKIHTSISFLPNGHLLMSTHTTDKAPAHPVWIPEGYYSHTWEGFSGSHLIEYDPETRTAHTLGIPVPFESIYGGIYVAQTNRFYFLGYFRGHLYSYDLDSKKVKDYGQVTEYGCFRLHQGPDGKLYWSTRSGYLARLNPVTDQVEQLSLRFQHSQNGTYSNMIMRLDYAVNLPDGKMLMAPILTDGMYLMDTKNDTMIELGSYGEEYLPEDPTRRYSAPFCLTLDQEGVLWYVLESNYDNGASSTLLMRWDFQNGRQPEPLGTLGTPETRMVAGVSEAHIYNDVLYIADTNHGNDMPGVFSIDLSQFRSHCRERSTMPTDPYLNSSTEQYQEMDRIFAEFGAFNQQNPMVVQCKRWNALDLWRGMKPEQSAVRQVALRPDGTVCGLCGGEGAEYYFASGSNGITMKSASDAQEDIRAYLSHENEWPLGQMLRELSVPGRQYKAVVTAAAKLSGERWIVGTRDGVMGIVRANGAVYRLGRACPNGPIHALSSSADGSVAYGVGGDESDLGIIVRYTDEKGLEELGTLRFNMDVGYTVGEESFQETAIAHPGIHMSSQPCCLDVSKDGKTVAVGVADRLGTVYLLYF
jgi:hypothetical protein